MTFARPNRQTFPLLPPYWAHDPTNGHSHIMPLNTNGITPYLSLRAKLSQVWINRWTILLLLVLARVLIAISATQDSMSSAKRQTLSACTSVESMGSSMASMPHYLSQGVNEMAASAVDSAVRALHSMLFLTVTGVEDLVIFILKVMYQTYLCLITLAVRGSVHVAAGLLEDAAGFLNSTIKHIGKDIDNAVNSFEHGLNDFLADINTAASVFGGSVPILNINDTVNELENLRLPSSIDKDLNKLNNSIPTFSEVQNFTENIIRLPFEEIKKLMNDSLGSYIFDRSVLPVPEKRQLSFCNDNDGINEFFHNLHDTTITARKIFIIALLIAAVLACIPAAWQEVRRWQAMKERSLFLQKEAHDQMDIVYIVSRPYSAAAGIKAANYFSNSRRQILVRWAVAYATSMPALFVLCLSIAGLFSCLCQYIFLRSVEKAVPDMTVRMAAFADDVVGSLQNQSVEWANGTNTVIRSINRDLNHNIFGWVNTSTGAINDTLNTFVEKTIVVLNDTFGGTPLYNPITEVFNCLIGLKVESVQKGLTWVSDHAQVDFPPLPDDMFSLGATQSIAGSVNSSVSDSFLAGAGNTASNEISEIIIRVVDKIAKGIRTEAIIATAIFLVWIIIALIGAMRALILFCGRGKAHDEGIGLSRLNLDNFGNVPLATGPSRPNGGYSVAECDSSTSFGGSLSSGNIVVDRTLERKRWELR